MTSSHGGVRWTRWVLGALVVAAALLLTLVVLNGIDTPRSGPEPLVTVGIAVEDLDQVDRFVERTGVTPDVVDVYKAWGDSPQFDRPLADELANRGIIPKITWEPWAAVPSGDPAGADQPGYALRTIIDGDHDPYIERWAGHIASYGGPVILRFAHEMNGGWYPWGAGVNDNRTGEYVAAWHHVQDVFETAGATNVLWEWAPNQESPGSAPLEPLYPGDDHVDRIGISAYNWGTNGTGEDHLRWRSFPDLVDGTLEHIGTFAGQPLGVAETGSSTMGGDRAAWIAEMFDHALERELAFVNYFEMDTQRRWRFTDDPDAVEAFVTGFAATRGAD